MKIIRCIESYIMAAALLSCSGCSNAYFSSSIIEKAKAHQNKGRYDKAIELASSPAAYRENPKEASKIVSESTKAQMLEDIDLIWDGKLSDEVARKKGYIIHRDRFDGSGG